MTADKRTRPAPKQPRTSGIELERLTFDEYAAKYDEFFEMERVDGVIEVAHRNGDGWTGVWSQAWRDIGNDPDNKVAIITNVGDAWLDVPSTSAGGPPPSDIGEWVMNIYRETIVSLEHLLFSLRMPTIAAVRGPSAPGIHLEVAMMCDLTLCSDDAVFREFHLEVGAAPGDGQFLALQRLIGIKRAAHYAFTGDGIDAETALRLGLVSEVCTADELLPRARELARRIASMSDAARYMTTQMVRRPWLKSYVDDVGFQLAHEMLGVAADTLSGRAITPASWEASYRRAHEINESLRAARANGKDAGAG